MKFVIINDTHAGVRNGSDVFLDYAESFYHDILFPYMEKHNITKIVHLGDFFDNRRVLNVKVLNRIKRVFLDELVNRGWSMDIILGNHDVYYKNTNNLSATYEILHNYDNVTIIAEPRTIKYDGLDIAMLPWITKDNHDESMALIKNSSAKFLFGHLEMAGFEMMRSGMVTKSGLPISLFKRYELVLSGHYHTRSHKVNVMYLGTQLEHTWADCKDPKYFYVFDTDERTLEEILTGHYMYYKLRYKPGEDLDDYTLNKLAGRQVKVIVDKKTDIAHFEGYINRIQNANPDDLKIVETLSTYLEGTDDADITEFHNTIELMNEYVDSIAILDDTVIDKSELKRRLQTLYNDALNSND
jgi:DNA repair exonuclease SbcCD nuclease subunit